MAALAPAPSQTELAQADAFCRRLARRHYENFTVASAVLPGELRVHLARVYAYCRLTDDLGDESRSDARLRAWRDEVCSALAADGPTSHPVLLALRETVTACSVPLQPFLDLISANLLDQRVTGYATWIDLEAYCRLSAAPVGRMVLAVLGIRGERAEELSDSVCIGLQLANFAQDVALDARLGRCYLPQDEVSRLGLHGAVRSLCERAERLLESGCELEAMTSGRLRAQLAMYRLGGTAILGAIRRSSFRTDTVRPQVSRTEKARLATGAIALLAGDHARGPSRAGGIVEAERVCQRLARRHAANFYWGFIALPRPQRTAIYSLYDFARQVDDAVDTPGIVDPRAELDEMRRRLHRALAGEPDDEVTTVLARAVALYRIPLEELDALIDGVECDLTSRGYATWPELTAYCRLVASTVGRMCVRIFGFDDQVALSHADDLGLAMQLTNILRDVRGDLEIGRLYLPTEELAWFGVGVEDLTGGHVAAGWDAFVDFQAQRAHRLFASGLRVQRHIPKRAGICVRTMAGMYQRTLQEIEQQPQLPLQRRLSLPPATKAAVLLRATLPQPPRPRPAGTRPTVRG
ncbi:MAG: squalene/phytoene synthase family protein [Candidatus Dormibacteraeota bacterium]|uniref:Squalene/phytoene synthase family protein n=1 Tax=Candidatus Amunia macphersoniae TaxID=3127014 RepID=A0A934NIY0_9BACT|nr:squalene/phytoene synthase family protein [Candidatus Dormibacteraeota bacterium]